MEQPGRRNPVAFLLVRFLLFASVLVAHRSRQWETRYTWVLLRQQPK